VPTFDPKTLTERDLIARGGAIAYTALRVAEDMFTLNDSRIRTLAKHRIVNPGVNDLHALAKESLEKAQKALQEKDYAALDVYARMSWGYSARAYPDVKATANDVVNGVIFYLALLMPFAYFMERLLFGAPNLKSQLTYASLIFVAVFLLFRYIHPAFDITGNPVIVFIAFTMGALSVIVGVFIAGKFEEQLKRIQKQVIGSHTADVGRMSVAAAAFNLGVSNMRRRPLRTFLTSLSLVLVTFIVLSFTSIVNVLRFNEAPAPGAPRYNGIMMRTVDWQPLRESAYRLMNDEFGKERAVAPRAWFFGTQIGEQAFITLQRADRRFSARAIVGMTPAEAKVTRPQEALSRRQVAAARRAQRDYPAPERRRRAGHPPRRGRTRPHPVRRRRLHRRRHLGQPRLQADYRPRHRAADPCGLHPNATPAVAGATRRARRLPRVCPPRTRQRGHHALRDGHQLGGQHLLAGAGVRDAGRCAAHPAQ
jgi:hypothetical protein